MSYTSWTEQGGGKGCLEWLTWQFIYHTKRNSPVLVRAESKWPKKEYPTENQLSWRWRGIWDSGWIQKRFVLFDIFTSKTHGTTPWFREKLCTCHRLLRGVGGGTPGGCRDFANYAFQSSCISPTGVEDTLQNFILVLRTVSNWSHGLLLANTRTLHSDENWTLIIFLPKSRAFRNLSPHISPTKRTEICCKVPNKSPYSPHQP